MQDKRLDEFSVADNENIYRLLKYILIIIIFSTFIQPYSIGKSIAQQPYPFEWYTPKLWEYSLIDEAEIFIISGIPFNFKRWNGKTILTRLDRNNGKPIWFQILPNLFFRDNWYILDLNIRDDKLFFTSWDTKQLDCYDLNSGNILWKQDLSGLFGDFQVDISCPVPICNKVLLWVRNPSQSVILCYDSQTGDMLWKTNNTPLFKYPIVNNKNKYTQIEDRFYYLSNDHYIYCVDLNNGIILWKSDFSFDDVYRYAIYGRKTEIKCYNEDGQAFLYSFDSSNGHFLKRDILGYYSPFTLQTETILYRHKKGWVLYSLTDNKEIWQTEPTDFELSKPSFFDNKTILFWKIIRNKNKDYFQPIGVSLETGQILWQAKGDEIETNSYPTFTPTLGRIYGYGYSYRYNHGYSSFICFGDPAIDYPEPPSRITDSMGTP